MKSIKWTQSNKQSLKCHQNRPTFKLDPSNPTFKANANVNYAPMNTISLSTYQWCYAQASTTVVSCASMNMIIHKKQCPFCRKSIQMENIHKSRMILRMLSEVKNHPIKMSKKSNKLNLKVYHHRNFKHFQSTTTPTFSQTLTALSSITMSSTLTIITDINNKTQ